MVQLNSISAALVLALGLFQGVAAQGILCDDGFKPCNGVCILNINACASVAVGVGIGRRTWAERRAASA